MNVLDVSERRACRALGQHRSTQHKVPREREDEAALTADLVELAHQYGRYGYRKIGALLKAAGWFVNDNLSTSPTKPGLARQTLRSSLPRPD